MRKAKNRKQAPGLAVGGRRKPKFCRGCRRFIVIIADAMHDCPESFEEVKHLKGWKKSR